MLYRTIYYFRLIPIKQYSLGVKLGCPLYEALHHFRLQESFQQLLRPNAEKETDVDKARDDKCLISNHETHTVCDFECIVIEHELNIVI